MTNRIAVVDYGMGNLRSVEQALRHVAGESEVVLASTPDLIESADRVVFPGQGAMRDCMAELDTRNLRQAVINAAASKPFLGICIGLQMLFDHSEEGDAAGLGILSGQVKRFALDLKGADGLRLKVPHMGWNDVAPMHHSPLIVPGEAYFLHSYHFVPEEGASIAAMTDHGGGLVAAVGRDNVLGVQFHPEKSQDNGLRLLQNWVNWSA